MSLSATSVNTVAGTTPTMSTIENCVPTASVHSLSNVIWVPVFEAIVRSLKEGQKIELRGFGSFRLRERGARMGRNPKTGVKVSVPAKKIPYFKPGKELKELINR